MIKAAVLGATGYAGIELVRLLTTHPEVQIPNPEFDQWCDDVIEAHSLGMQSFIARHPRKYL